ncbi:hypothetical protein MY4824_008433 [Beauveria thailandica]
MVWFTLTQSIEYWFLALGELSPFHFFVAFISVFYSAQATALFFQFLHQPHQGQERGQLPVLASPSAVHGAGDGGEQGQRAERQRAVVDGRRALLLSLRPEVSVPRSVNLETKKGQFSAAFYDPSSGSIRIDDRTQSSLNPRLYRRAVSLVRQEPTLFAGSIRENIALDVDSESSDTPVSDADIEAALRAANAWEFVVSLPDGVHTVAGANGGSQLSGGQRQRVVIVRDSRVLLLDEAMSALDTASERVVQAALAEAARRGDRITVAVVHRLSTMKDADVICMFYAGPFVEQGTHAGLFAQGGMYRDMCEAQNLD